jgi:tetratricopeptide (TPR) repeat protein
LKSVGTGADLLPIHLIVGDDDQVTGERAAEAIAASGATVVPAPPAQQWPFVWPLAGLPPGPVVVWAPDADLAFDTRQPPHTRLVTTQAHYLMVEWAAALAAHGQATMIATARREPLQNHVPDALRRRGVFSRLHLEELGATAGQSLGDRPVSAENLSQADCLARAFGQERPEARLQASVDALAGGRTAPALVATASVCQEVNDLEGAARDLDEAVALAPDWAAAHFERGKVWLRLDDMEAAARCFRRAAEQLPGFGGAWGNLGAALGELDRPGDALNAFEHLLALEPSSPQAHNNIGVLTRELGRLPDSEAAFRRVIELEPNLAFGYYNLGHTLFLQGRYHAAASAYGQGQGRDPDRNPVQATRLALCRLATGDAAGALAELKRASGALPRDYRRQVLSDTSAVLWALVTHKPELAGWQGVHDWLNGELSKLA